MARGVPPKAGLRPEEREARPGRIESGRNAKPLPNFCRYLCDRFGENWISPRGPCTPEAFRRAKRDYESMVGVRVYSQRYLRQFHPEASA